MPDIELVNPFCGSPAPIVHPALDNRFGYRVTNVKVNEKKLSAEPVFEQFDQVQEIQACKDLCGMEYMKMLLKSGQAKASDFYDDGNSGVDMTQFPANEHEAKRSADKNAEELQKIAEAVGAKENEGYSSAQLEALVEQKVKEIYEASQKAVKKEGE